MYSKHNTFLKLRQQKSRWIFKKHSVPCFELDAMILRAGPIPASQKQLADAGLSKYEPDLWTENLIRV